MCIVKTVFYIGRGVDIILVFYLNEWWMEWIDMKEVFGVFISKVKEMNHTMENEMGDLLDNSLCWYKCKTSVHFLILYLFLPCWY